MAKTTYFLTSFNSEEAASGKLVVMVTAATVPSANITNSDSNFKGVGICKQAGNNFSLVCNGITYIFNQWGNAYSSNTTGLKLLMGRLMDQVSEAGSTAQGTQTVTTTRTSEGEVSTVVSSTVPNPLMIESLNARDQFAAQALRGILSHIDDPSTLSDTEMNMYCQAAYNWAANMMTAAASVRASFDDQSESDELPEQAAVGILENNQEKLLNNLIVALERTDATLTDDEDNEYYAEQVKLVNFKELTDKLTTTDTVLTALKDNVTNAMTNMQNTLTLQNGYINNIVTQLSLINSSLQGFTQNMDADMTNINNNVTAARSQITSLQTDTDSLVNNLNTTKSTVNTINSNLNTVKADVAVIKVNTQP